MKKTAKAYGKINLSLEITGILPNGYHSLKTVMQSISLHNRITVERNDSGIITLSSDDKTLPTDRKNTAYRAAELFLEVLKSDEAGLDIYIEKNVPYQAGMGSASADAAGVLAAANSLFGDILPQAKLLELAAKVGSDVPFCLIGGTALAEGIGEKLTSLPPLPDCGLLIYHPNKGISTPEAYRRFDEMTDPSQPDCVSCISAINSGSLKTIAQSCGNVFELCCDIDDVFDIKKELLKTGALTACMTGSGTAVFGIFENLSQAKAAACIINRPEWRSWTASPVNCGIEIE